MDLPTPNIPLLRKAVEWAEAEAAKTDGTGLWNQSWWAEETTCGTAYCIAGYTVAVGLPEAEIVTCDCDADCTELQARIDGEYVSWADAGRQLLGITEDEQRHLFSSTNTIADVREIAEQIAARAGERL